jgi:hypothetical protein
MHKRLYQPRLTTATDTSKSTAALVAGLIALGFLVAVLAWPTGDRNTQVSENIPALTSTVTPTTKLAPHQ